MTKHGWGWGVEGRENSLFLRLKAHRMPPFAFILLAVMYLEAWRKE